MENNHDTNNYNKNIESLNDGPKPGLNETIYPPLNMGSVNSSKPALETKEENKQVNSDILNNSFTDSLEISPQEEKKEEEVLGPKADLTYEKTSPNIELDLDVDPNLELTMPLDLEAKVDLDVTDFSMVDKDSHKMRFIILSLVFLIIIGIIGWKLGVMSANKKVADIEKDNKTTEEKKPDIPMPDFLKRYTGAVSDYRKDNSIILSGNNKLVSYTIAEQAGMKIAIENNHVFVSYNEQKYEINIDGASAISFAIIPTDTLDGKMAILTSDNQIYYNDGAILKANGLTNESLVNYQYNFTKVEGYSFNNLGVLKILNTPNNIESNLYGVSNNEFYKLTNDGATKVFDDLLVSSIFSSDEVFYNLGIDISDTLWIYRETSANNSLNSFINADFKIEIAKNVIGYFVKGNTIIYLDKENDIYYVTFKDNTLSTINKYKKLKNLHYKENDYLFEFNDGTKGLLENGEVHYLEKIGKAE